MNKQTPDKVPVLGSRRYPCGCGRYINKPTAVGVTSRRCPSCKAHWVLHVEASPMAERMGRPILRIRWDVS